MSSSLHDKMASKRNTRGSTSKKGDNKNAAKKSKQGEDEVASAGASLTVLQVPNYENIDSIVEKMLPPHSRNRVQQTPPPPPDRPPRRPTSVPTDSNESNNGYVEIEGVGVSGRRLQVPIPMYPESGQQHGHEQQLNAEQFQQQRFEQ